MNSLKFEWDDNKEAMNQKKHGVTFDEAKTIFADELGRLMPDPAHTIRIISARKADKSEKRQYEGGRYA